MGRSWSLRRHIKLASILLITAAVFNCQMAGPLDAESTSSVLEGRAVGTNVALNKTATAESYQSGHPASHANDSSTSTYWSADPYPQWWKVDLGGPYDINEINIVTYPSGSRYYKYTVHSSTNGTDWVQIADKQGTQPATSSGDTYTVTANGVRYLKVTMSYNSANTGVHIKNFKAFGVPSGGGGGDEGLGIGDAGLPETRTDYPVTTGVTRTLIKRGYKTGTDVNTTTTGPWQVNVLTINPDTYSGKIIGRLCGGKVNATATVQAEAASQGAYAAVNGSYFVISSSDGSVGASMTLGATAGQITNESINPRGGMLIPDIDSVKGIKLGRFTSSQSVGSSDGSSTTLNGFNRKPGVKMGVGPNYVPSHDTVTQFPNEVVLYRPIFGTSTESGTGAEAIINSSGVVTALYSSRGHAIPAGGAVLAGVGTGSTWISNHAQVGKTITVNTSLTLDGSPVTLGPDASIIAAGPCLVKNGTRTTSSYWAEEGFTDAGFIGRNPRTLVGTKSDGTLLIVLVDGRAIDVSVGATFEECATLMLSLGAVDVLNLDGGRSSVMVANGSVVSHILENRAVGDILELKP